MYNGSYKIKDRISNWLRSVLFFSCWRFRFGNHPGCRPWKHRLCDQLRNSRSMVYVPAVGAIDPEKTPLDWFNIYRNPIQNKNIPEEMNLLMSHERKPMFHGAPTIFFSSEICGFHIRIPCHGGRCHSPSDRSDGVDLRRMVMGVVRCNIYIYICHQKRSIEVIKS